MKNLNCNVKSFFIILLILSIGLGFLLPQETSAFVQSGQYSTYEPADFFQGIWHGLLAPWSLIARWFMDDVMMYAIPNTGWFYDFGFLIGTAGSVPFGWIVAIISVALYFLA